MQISAQNSLFFVHRSAGCIIRDQVLTYLRVLEHYLIERHVGLDELMVISSVGDFVVLGLVDFVEFDIPSNRSPSSMGHQALITRKAR